MTCQQQNKQIIREYIRQHFSDEKLAQVYAWNQDGKMLATDPCGCLLGVTSSAQIHNWSKEGCPNSKHYFEAKAIPGAVEAEQAFFRLSHGHSNSRRQPVMSAILRAEMKRRDAIRTRQEVATEAVCS
jgi:hypothetical protein